MLLWAFAWQYTVVSSRGPSSRTHPPNRPTDQPTTHPGTQRARHAFHTLSFLSLSLCFLHMCVSYALRATIRNLCCHHTEAPLSVKRPNDYTGRHNVLVIMRESSMKSSSWYVYICNALYLTSALEERSRNYLLTANSFIFKLMFVQTGRIIDLARALINNSIYALGRVI